MTQENKQQVVAVQESAMISIIAKAASDPNVDVAKLEKLLDMQERIMEKQAEIEFNLDMNNLRVELPAVVKNKANSQTNSRYADLEAIQKVVSPLLSKYGFYDRYEDDFPSERIVGTTCEIVHKNGFSRKNRVQFTLDDVGIKGTANKTATHATASSMTYGQRLSLCRALGVQISIDNDGNNDRAVLPIEFAAELDLLIIETKADKVKFLQFMKTDSVQNILAKDYIKARKALEDKKRKAGA
jgi:hypothetical protein